MKIIGCGNGDWGDDQAGLLVADRLRRLGFNAEPFSGEPLELLDKWTTHDEIILVDAVMTGATAGSVHEWDSQLPLDHGGEAASSHGFDIGKALELARALGRLPRKMRIYGIEGRRFEVGSGISSEIENAVNKVVERIAAQKND